MNTLPNRTTPAASAVERRHSPPRGAYPTYRACLRWEFGFSCAFCLTHESDLVEHGIEGTGLTSIEHQLPQSHDAAGVHVNEYANCFYACRFCNRARGTEPTMDGSNLRLLDPCRDAWGEHFTAVEDRLIPRAGDANAARTHRTYDLDEPRKREMRRQREEVLRDAFQVLMEGPDRLARLLERAEVAQAAHREELIGAARLLRGTMVRARLDIGRFSAVPRDADTRCRCRTKDGCKLPPFLEAQLRAFPG